MLSEAPGKEGVPLFPEEKGAGVPKTPLHFIASGLGLSFRIVSVCSTVSTYAYRDAVLSTTVKRLAGQRSKHYQLCGDMHRHKYQTYVRTYVVRTHLRSTFVRTYVSTRDRPLTTRNPAYRPPVSCLSPGPRPRGEPHASPAPRDMNARSPARAYSGAEPNGQRRYACHALQAGRPRERARKGAAPRLAPGPALEPVPGSAPGPASGPAPSAGFRTGRWAGPRAGPGARFRAGL